MLAARRAAWHIWQANPGFTRHGARKRVWLDRRARPRGATGRGCARCDAGAPSSSSGSCRMTSSWPGANGERAIQKDPRPRCYVLWGFAVGCEPTSVSRGMKPAATPVPRRLAAPSCRFKMLKIVRAVRESNVTRGAGSSNGRRSRLTWRIYHASQRLRLKACRSSAELTFSAFLRHATKIL